MEGVMSWKKRTQECDELCKYFMYSLGRPQTEREANKVLRFTDTTFDYIAGSHLYQHIFPLTSEWCGLLTGVVNKNSSKQSSREANTASPQHNTLPSLTISSHHLALVHSPGAGSKGGWEVSTCRFLISSILLKTESTQSMLVGFFNE